MRTPTVRPATPSSSTDRTLGAGRLSEVESHGSWPPITSNRSAASATVVAMGPIWSSELAKATRPYRDTVP